MVQPVVTNQNIPLVPPQEVLSGLNFGHDLPRDIGPYHILFHSWLELVGLLLPIGSLLG